MKANNSRLLALVIFSLILIEFSKVIAIEKNQSDLKWSSKFKAYPVLVENKFINFSEDYVYLFQGFGEVKPIGLDERIVKYDIKNDTVQMSPIKLRTDNIKRVRLYVCVTNDTIHVISYFNNRSHNSVYIFDETYNTNTLESNNDVHKISEIEYDKTNIINSKDIYIEMKKNEYVKDRIGLYFFYETKNEYIHGHQVFDNKFSLKAKYNQPTDKKTLMPNYVFDNNDNLYTIERYTQQGSSYDHNSSKVKLVYYPKVGNSPIVKTVELENSFIVDLKLSVNNKNQVICSGLYSKINTQSAIGGFSIMASPQLAIADVTTKIEFDIALIIEGKSKQESEDIKKNISRGKNFDGEYSYTIHDIHFRKDGGYTMIVDKNAKAYGGKGTYDYYYGDIYILTFDSLGKSQWTQKIFRAQVIGESGFNEHILGGYLIDYGKNDNITVIYNILNSGLFISQGEKINNTIVCKIDTYGNKTQNILISDEKISKTFSPEISHNCGDGKFIVTKFNFLSNMLNNTFNLGVLSIK